MEKELQNEFYELNVSTWRLLRQRDHILHSKHCPIFQYLVMPWFQNTLCLDFVFTEEVLAIYHTTWRKDLDIQAFATPVERMKYPRRLTPTVESDLLSIDENDAVSILK
jgi:hypothetical protein